MSGFEGVRAMSGFEGVENKVMSGLKKGKKSAK